MNVMKGAMLSPGSTGLWIVLVLSCPFGRRIVYMVSRLRVDRKEDQEIRNFQLSQGPFGG